MGCVNVPLPFKAQVYQSNPAVITAEPHYSIGQFDVWLIILKWKYKEQNSPRNTSVDFFVFKIYLEINDSSTEEVEEQTEQEKGKL